MHPVPHPLIHPQSSTHPYIEAGTLGRVLGDIAITVCSIYTPKDQLVNVLYTPIVIGMIIIIFLCAQYFDQMEV